MERIHLLVKVVTLNSLLSLISCSGYIPTKQDMVGTWKSNDGGILILKEDSSFVISNVTTPVFDNPSGQKLDCKGKWYLVKKQGHIELEIQYNSFFVDGQELIEPYGVRTYFSIVGSGFIGNNPPWEIYTNTLWYEEDEADYTKFKKVE